MPTFLPGLQLSERFYTEIVRPLLDAQFPDLVYSAALIGPGSEVLGFDTEISTDHDWGPRLLLFLSEADLERHNDALERRLDSDLPETFCGYPLHCNQSAERPGESRKHRLIVTTMGSFFLWYLGLDPFAPLSGQDWLRLSQQKLRTLTAGKVFHDGLGELEPLRRTLAWFPRDVWLYLMAAEWTQIGQEMAFMGRCGDVGDELGSTLVAARLVRHLMKLCFLMEQQYAPYTKWFGTAFSRLACAETLTSLLQQAVSSSGWQAREKPLAAAYEQVAAIHNALGLTPQVETKVSSYYDRPYMVIGAGEITERLLALIEDADIKSVLANAGLIGAIDQFVDCTDVLENTSLCAKLDTIYG